MTEISYAKSQLLLFHIFECHLYQVHDEVELYGEVNNKEDTGPAILGVCGHHHIRKTTRKRNQEIQHKTVKLAETQKTATLSLKKRRIHCLHATCVKITEQNTCTAVLTLLWSAAQTD